MQNEDIDTAVKLADPPFYFDNWILTSKAEIREKYVDLFSEKTVQNLEISSLKAKTISELKSEGYDVERDRIISNLGLNDNDIAVLITTKNEGIIVFFRTVNNEVLMAGFWD